MLFGGLAVGQVDWRALHVARPGSEDLCATVSTHVKDLCVEDPTDPILNMMSQHYKGDAYKSCDHGCDPAACGSRLLGCVHTCGCCRRCEEMLALTPRAGLGWDEELPVLFMLPGMSRWIDEPAYLFNLVREVFNGPEESPRGLQDLVDALGFILVVVEGRLDETGMNIWDVGFDPVTLKDRLRPGMLETSHDVDFIADAMHGLLSPSSAWRTLQGTPARLSLRPDPKRIFIYGSALGALMAVKFTCTHPQLIAGLFLLDNLYFPSRCRIPRLQPPRPP